MCQHCDEIREYWGNSDDRFIPLLGTVQHNILLTYSCQLENFSFSLEYHPNFTWACFGFGLRSLMFECAALAQCNSIHIFSCTALRFASSGDFSSPVYICEQNNDLLNYNLMLIEVRFNWIYLNAVDSMINFIIRSYL